MTRPPPGTPWAIVLAGANGAGKTTLAPALLRDELGLATWVNADVIAQGLSGFAPEAAAREAGRIMLRRLDALEAARESFAFESTLSGTGHARRLQRLRAGGYEVVVLFLWLPSPELAVARVAMRVRHGGHHVPPERVRRRWARGLRNLFRLYLPIASQWRVYDASGGLTDDPALPIVARGEGERMVEARDLGIWRRITDETRRLREAPEPGYAGSTADPGGGEEGDRFDRAVTRAFHAAVRLHRMHGLPLVVWGDEEVRYVDPRSVPLPEDGG